MNSVIVLEALDGVGKTTVAKILARKMNAVLYRPSEKIIQFVNESVKLPYGSPVRSENIRESLEMMSNEIKEITKYSTVVIDRFYASWASAEAGDGNLRMADLSIDNWPRNLIKPNLSIHLRVDEDVRLARIGSRAHQNDREIRLGNDQTYRHRVLRSLTRLTNYDVDNTFRTPDETASRILQIFRNIKERRNPLSVSIV